MRPTDSMTAIEILRQQARDVARLTRIAREANTLPWQRVGADRVHLDDPLWPGRETP